ncbi:MAG: transposase [Paraglaciecola sp.]|jgi:transposase
MFYFGRIDPPAPLLSIEDIKMMQVNTIRAIVRAKFVMPDITVREQSRFAGASSSATHRMNKRCEKYQIDHPLLDKLNDKEAKEALRIETIRISNKRDPDFNAPLKELSKKRGKRKTRTVLYLEYRAIDPVTALSKSQYFRRLNKVMKRVKIVMKQHHAAGETVYIDYAGTQVFYKKSGEKIWVKVFVAVLGASKKIFAFATFGEKTVHWIDGMTRAFDYYGGRTEGVSMDNAKALVSEPGLIANLVDNVQAWSWHYGCLMDTCRVGRPQDKSLAELGVKFVNQRILIPMLEMTFFSLKEINVHISREVELLNNENFQGFNISRNDLFELGDKSALKPNPKIPFEIMADRKLLRVQSNYHFKYQKHEYSVPYALAGEIVDVVVTNTHLKITHQHRFIYQHEVSDEIMGATTIPSHMPAEHLADYNMCDKDLNLEWAHGVSEPVETLVVQWYEKTVNPKSRPIAKRCKALMNIFHKKGPEVLTKACEYALLHDMETPSDINLIISAQNQENGFENLPVHIPTHENVRGKDYYEGNYDV